MKRKLCYSTDLTYFVIITYSSESGALGEHHLCDLGPLVHITGHPAQQVGAQAS
jgi:hypothetical protein